jgi:hypothetical protein
MDQVRLPIRLVPRKDAQIRPLAHYCVFFVIAGFWMFMARSEEPPTFGVPPLADPDIQALFPWFGAAFFLVGLTGVASVLAKTLPGGPFFHIDLAVDGLTIRRWVTRRHFAWQDVPPFAPLQVERNVKGGIRIDHYTVAMQRDQTGVPREALRIGAGEYGAADAADDATALSGWLNALRTMALEGRLAGALIEVPAAFQSSMRPLAAR